MTTIIDYGTSRISHTIQSSTLQPLGLEAVLSEAQAAEVDAWHKRAERNLDDGRAALRARRDAMNRLSQQRNVELEAEATKEPSEEDVVLLAEAARLERVAKEKLARTGSNIESARLIVDGASHDLAAVNGQPRFESHDEFYDSIIALLAELDAEWLSKYEDLLANYIDFFDDLTRALAKLSGAIEGTDKDGNFEMNLMPVIDALQAVIDEWRDKPLVGGFDDEVEAEAFLADLGVQGLYVVPDGNGKYEIRVDTRPETGPIQELQELFGDKLWWFGWSTPDKLDPAQYNAMIAAKDSRLERLSQINNLLAEKYNRQNQQWDTLAKVLSNSIKEMDEAQRSFVNGL